MRRELTWQAVSIALVVAVLVSASYPYVILKLGWGPNVSVVSALLGAGLLMALTRNKHGRNRLMINVVQTAGTSAGMTAFMAVIAAAVDLAVRNPAAASRLNGITHIEPWPMFFWLTSAGGIGVLFTVLFRRHFLDDKQMIFADGVAVAETIRVLDSVDGQAAPKLRMLGLSAALSAAVDWLRVGWERLPDLFFSPLLKSYKVGIEWNLLSVGSGMLIGPTVSLSLLLGTLILAATSPLLLGRGIGAEIVLSSAPPGEVRQRCQQLIDRDWQDLDKEQQDFLRSQNARQVQYAQRLFFPVLMLWFMWPATALMIAASLTSVILKWRSLVRTFAQLRLQSRRRDQEDVSLSTIVLGSVLLTCILALVQYHNFGMSGSQTAVAVLFSLPLILVGVRVHGETSLGPVSLMMNGLQAVFAVFWPTSIGHNLIAAGMAGSCNAQAEGTMQDYKTGQLVGSTPWVLTWVQLAAVPIGAAAVAVMYPLLLQRYELGDTLPAPTGLKIANLAILLSQGADAFPRGALPWTGAAAVIGVLLVLIKELLQAHWLPSAAGLGLGMILPGTLTVPMAVGGALCWVWSRSARASFDRYAVTVASGLIAGEAVVGGLVIPAVGWILHS
jgi:uncharacterized oligopeptide transporter (OPT) family protein